MLITPTLECMLTEGEAVELGPEILGSDEGSIPETEIYLETEDGKRLKMLVDEFQDVFKAKSIRTETTHIEIKHILSISQLTEFHQLSYHN